MNEDDNYHVAEQQRPEPEDSGVEWPVYDEALGG